MKKLLLVTVTFCLTTFSYSQNDFRIGFIITSTRDTVTGLVNYREGAGVYKACEFRKSIDQNTVVYGPDEIVGYGFADGALFLSKEISIKGEPKIVFLEVVVRGLVSLYRFERTFFAEKNDNGLQQLINETKEVVINGVRVEKNSNEYIGTLSILLFDCAELRSRVQKIGMSEKPLTNLVHDYNKCMGAPSITFMTDKAWAKVRTGIIGGASISILSFGRSGYKHLAGTSEASISPMVGLSFDVLSPRLSQRISFHLDMHYLDHEYYNYTKYISNLSTETNYVTVDLQQLKMPIGLRYTLPERNFTPFINVGFTGSVILGWDTEWTQEIELSSSFQTYDNEGPTFKNGQSGLWGSCGVSKSIGDKLSASIELRYERSIGFCFPYSGAKLEFQTSNYQLIFGLRTR